MNCEIEQLDTEKRNPKTMHLDEMSPLQIAEAMNNEDLVVVKVIRERLPEISKAMEVCAFAYQNGGRIIYMGAGSSGRYAVADAVECPPTFGVKKNTFTAILAGGHRAIWNSVEGAEDNVEAARKDIERIKITSKDVFVGLAASGRTPYVIAGLEVAKKAGCKIITVSCNQGALISKYADIAISVSCGPEIITGSTRLKSGTAEKLVLNMISTGAMVRSGKVYQNLMVDVIQSNEKLRARAVRIVVEATGCDVNLASEKLKEADGFCKVAITSILLRCSVEQAKKALNKNNGFVHKAVEEIKEK